MNRTLIRSSAFVRAARAWVKRRPQVAEDIQAALELLTSDAYHPLLHTHKLKGKFKDSWACSAGYDLRIMFKFVEHDGSEAILLETIGTHDEVY